MECPFLCGFRTSDEDQAEYQLTAHIELLHTPDSLFATEDKDLAFALALQREEEEALANSNIHGKSVKPQIAGLGHEKEVTAGQAPSADDDFPYVECPYSDCEKFVLIIDYNEHMDTHLSLSHSSDTIVTKMANFDSGYDTDHAQSLATQNENAKNRSLGETALAGQGSHTSAITIARTVTPYLRQPPGKENIGFPDENKKRGTRLGRRELGPYAWEERMPDAITRRLQRGEPARLINRIGKDGQLIRERMVENEVCGLVPVLARLCAASDSLETAYFCHPSVQHVFKGPNQSHFCGYRNIQMLVSFLQCTRANGHEHFGTQLPNILQIQDLIEKAWDNGFCTFARQETGGIRNTRKWIGTPEAEAIFNYLGLIHSVDLFSSQDGKQAHEYLLNHVETYFLTGSFGEQSRIQKTDRPPIFLQQPGHSLTIIGLERFKNGSRNLLIFDPSFGPSERLMSLITAPSGPVISKSKADQLLRTYRRGESRLRRYDAFEILAPIAPDALPI